VATLRKLLCEQRLRAALSSVGSLGRHSWGESAGAISTNLQLLTNNGNPEGLFRGAIMQSGGPIPVGDIVNGQHHYDFMVDNTGCGGSSDTLNCLRNVPYSTYKRAMDMTPNFFSYQARVYVTTSLCNRLLHDSLGTRAGVVATCRWRLPDRTSTIFCPTGPRSKRTSDQRCVQCAVSRHKN